MSYLHPLSNTVNYKGVERDYQIGTSREYDAWMDDDGGGSDFYGEMNSFGAVDRRKDAALESAKKEYERRQALDRRISANASGVAENRGLIDENRGLIDEMQATPDTPSAAEISPSPEISAAQEGKDAYLNDLENTGSQMFANNAKDQIKDSMSRSGIPTRGPGSFADKYAFNVADNFIGNRSINFGGGATVANNSNVDNSTKTTVGNDNTFGDNVSLGNNSSGNYLNSYKLAIGDKLQPVDRDSQVQADKDKQQAASMGAY